MKVNIPEPLIPICKMTGGTILVVSLVVFVGRFFDKPHETGEKMEFPFAKYEITPPKKAASATPKNFSERYFEFVKFRQALAFRESGGRYHIVNRFGYLGKYQFGTSTLADLGVDNTDEFLKNPILQEQVFILNVARNKWILRKEIRHFTGKKIKNCNITESGLIAAAHLAGPGNVKKYLRSSGKRNVSDALGTSLEDYLTQFAGYDISVVKQMSNPKVSQIQ